MKRGPKLTEQQREELLLVYLTEGFEAAAPLAASMGISIKSISALARRRGHVGNYHRHITSKNRPRTKDRRWQWAIERGAVTA